MNFLNTCILEGHLTADAESRNSKNGGMLTLFSIAQNRNYVNSKNELIRETSFFDIEVWGDGFANKAGKFLTKGVPVRVIGRLKMDYWNDENGKRRERAVIVCEKFDFLPSLQSEKSKKFNTGELYNDESENITVQNVEPVIEEKVTKTKKRAAV